jgi:hypothetical protein
MDSRESEPSRLYPSQWNRAKKKTDGELLIERFLAVQLCDHTCTRRANAMAATRALM